MDVARSGAGLFVLGLRIAAFSVRAEQGLGREHALLEQHAQGRILLIEPEPELEAGQGADGRLGRLPLVEQGVIGAAGQSALMLRRIGMHRLELGVNDGQAPDFLGRRPRPAQRRQQEAHQEGNDDEDDQ